MLFTADAHPGLASGEITLTFRVWKRPQVKVGGTYRIAARHADGGVFLEVDAVDVVPAGSITDTEARRAGAEDRGDLLARLRRLQPDLDASTPVYRVRFHRVDPPSDPPLSSRDRLGPEDVAEIVRRLERLERNRDPWTRRVLELIAEHPAVVSTELAAMLDRERFALKEDVRRLKRLDLTESLPVGYRLSARGRAFLDST